MGFAISYGKQEEWRMRVLQPASDDGNATNLGREIYDRAHRHAASVAGERSAAWQALRLETFGANRLPLLARLAQRWARVAILRHQKRPPIMVRRARSVTSEHALKSDFTNRSRSFSCNIDFCANTSCRRLGSLQRSGLQTLRTQSTRLP